MSKFQLKQPSPSGRVESVAGAFSSKVDTTLRRENATKQEVGAHSRFDETRMRSRTCPACQRAEMDEFCSIRDVPTNSCILLDTTEDARSYPTGDIDLGFCHECGFISNVSFEQARTEYSGRYEETQGFSGTFNKFHRDLAGRIVDRYDLREKRILEIGCGKGEFLLLLSEIGNNWCVGVDPGVDTDRLAKQITDRLTFIPDFYSPEHVPEKVDFVVCKMTLEHIANVAEFIKDLRGGLADQSDATVFFQVPEAQRILQDVAFEDIYYEHCSYFSAGSLARLFRSAGFDVLGLSVEYSGQYLTIEARPSAGGFHRPLPEEHDLKSLQSLVASFPHRWTEKLEYWNHRLEQFREEGKTVALWGSGSKAVSFLTTLNARDYVALVTDINPYRQGYFMPKTAHPIVSPETLARHAPDVVIAMNPVYRDEIQDNLRELGMNCELLTL